MSYGIYGENNDETIVFLTGFGTLSPILTYGPLAKTLSEKFKVIIVEPFGYGRSDFTEAPRTHENIVEELHTFVHKLVIKKFYISGHSLGGLYSLFYANQYSDDVLGFIGFDNAIPQYDDVIIEDNKIRSEMYDELNNQYHNDILVKMPYNEKVELIKLILDPNYNYLEKEINAYITIFDRTYGSDNIVDEYHNVLRDMHDSINLKFPKSIPSLQIIATEGGAIYGKDEYMKSHQSIIYESPLNDIIYLEGNHYIMFGQHENILKEIEKWIKKLNNQK
ncbi:alpha/beta-hydrolase [Anaeromyces robustus]|uniref:Alpha/beta-hydrolase n=1 Tax=Anaeromyces robustus TaxID=1754192 RepID=A0A1Y1VZF3_9FUNG|nr:alpha/beta-hydrolase [Anaeromyces robustus]|eukprot:ORX66234.1 alpha/beta-hydrolase [Anaeromyces robustus]